MPTPTSEAADLGSAVASTTAPSASDWLRPGDAPTAWMLVEVDLTLMLRAIARQAAARQQRDGVEVTPLAVVLRAAVVALGDHPLLNAAWGGDCIWLHRSICLAVVGADARPRLIPRADKRSLVGLAQALANPGPLPPSPTFTVLAGEVAGVLAEPMLPVEQSACLIVGSPTRRLVAVDALLVTRSIATLAVVFDHRVLDGARSASSCAPCASGSKRPARRSWTRRAGRARRAGRTIRGLLESSTGRVLVHSVHCVHSRGRGPAATNPTRALPVAPIP